MTYAETLVALAAALAIDVDLADVTPIADATTDDIATAEIAVADGLRAAADAMRAARAADGGLTPSVPGATDLERSLRDAESEIRRRMGAEAQAVYKAPAALAALAA